MTISIKPAIEYINERVSEHTNKSPLIVSIDGRSAAGKSTFARLLQSGTDFPVIHTDDFCRPRDNNGVLNISMYEGNFDIQRFKKEVVDNLKLSYFTYGVFDCSKGIIAEMKEVTSAKCLIVEGAYSHHPLLGDYADIKLFFDIDPITQRKRILLRNIETNAENFKNIWIPAEERYFSHYGIIEKSHFIIVAQSEDNNGNIQLY